ncbi:MAG: serine hydrolase domain-containing protein, partial [Mycobacteriales bacterium]
MSWHADVDQVFAERFHDGAPGCAVGVVQDGELAFAKGYGSANLEHDVAITPETVFDIASGSKQFTAATALLLADAGALALDASVCHYLTQLPRDPFVGVTVRHLIQHTGGIPDYLVLMSMSGRAWANDYPEDELIDLIGRQRSLDFTPGTGFSYSNSGYLLLAEVIRAASGMSLRDAAQNRLFGPAGLTRTFFHDDASEVVPGRATAYAPHPDGGFRVDMPTIDVVGDGGAFTTVVDLALWDRQFSECTLPGGPSFMERLTTPGTLADGSRISYAFGLVRDSYRGCERIQHGGAWGGYRAQFLRLPEHQFSVIVLANVSSAPVLDLAGSVADVVLGARLAPRTAAAGVSLDLEPHLGLYLDDRASCILEIGTDSDGTAFIEFAGARMTALPVDSATLE